MYALTCLAPCRCTRRRNASSAMWQAESWARMSPSTRTGTRTFFSNSRKSVSFGSPWSYIFTGDRKSTRLNSSHGSISYAVFCLKKKNYVRYSLSCYHLKNIWSTHVAPETDHVLHMRTSTTPIERFILQFHYAILYIVHGSHDII